MKGEANMKSFFASVLSFLLALSSFFGVGDAEIKEKFNSFLNPEDCVSVIVELEGKSLLDDISGSRERKQLLEGYLKSESYEKITAAQETVKKLIKKTVSSADFGESYSYSFVLNGFSLVVPNRYVDEIEKLPGVKSVTVAERYSLPDDSRENEASDSSGRFKYNLFTGVPEAQKNGYTGKGLVVAVLDTGFDCGHEAFSSSVQSPTLSKKDVNLITTFRVLNTIVPRWNVNYFSEKIPYKWDYAERDKTVNNENSDHGTHVAGIIGGKCENLTGVAPDAQLLFMKVFGDEKNSVAKEEVNLAALDDSVKLGADVVNMSLGAPCGQGHDNVVSAAVYKKLQKSGIAVSASAGNEASLGENDAVAGAEKMNIDLFDYGTVGSPASYEWPMAVASSAIARSTSKLDDTLSVTGVGSADMSSFSSWGVTADLRLKPEITTPGSDIYSAVPGNGYRYMNGTSMAAPYYTGCFALVKQYINEKYPNLKKKNSAELVNSLLMSTAVPFRGSGEPALFSPRRQGAGLVAVEKALSTSAYLTQADGKSRPKLELGENTDGCLELSFKVHNLSQKQLEYSLREAVLTDSCQKQKNGLFVNTLTSKRLSASSYSCEYSSGESVTLAPGETKTVSLKITLSQDFLNSYKEIFKNGFFVDGFVFLDSKTEPTLSIPFVSFVGDWSGGDMLFDKTMYDDEPSYLGREWGLMVTDGESYYPLGANIFENWNEYGVDSKYCAYSTHALESRLKNPYVTTSVALLRNGGRMDYSLFTESGIFRYCGATLFERSRKTNNPNSPEIGVLWGGKGGLVNGQSYVYNVTTWAANYKGGRKTLSFPFVVDNEKPVVESVSYTVLDGEAILNIKIKDNRYVMGFEIFTSDEKSLGSVSFKGLEPDSNGVYTCSVNVSEKSKKPLSALQSLKLYVVDYAYNETYGEVSLFEDNALPTSISSLELAPAREYDFTAASAVVDKSSFEEESAASAIERIFSLVKKAFK